MQAYCFKCRAKRDMRNAKAVTMQNGKPATQGMCSVCGTKMYSFAVTPHFYNPPPDATSVYIPGKSDK
jgi:hypothetical protein